MKKIEIILYSGLAIGMLLVSVLLVVITLSDDEPKKSDSRTVKTRKRHSRGKGNSRTSKKDDKHNSRLVKKQGGEKFKMADKDEVEIRQEVERIDSRIKQTTDINEKLDLLDDLNYIEDPMILDIINRELNDPSTEIRLSALQLLENFEGKEVFPVLRKALDDSSEKIRAEAIDIIDDVEVPGGDPEEADILLKAINDPSEDVRSSALDAIDNKPSYDLEIIGDEAIKSNFPEVKEAILEALADTPSVRGVEVMIEGLNDPDPDFRNDVIDELELITDQSFNSYDEARKWWDQHQNEFLEEFSHYNDDISE
jgi:hypothetical protein